MNYSYRIFVGRGQRSYSISLIRLISLLFIVTCHIQQYLDIELAWWFNVGVQIFLCISGFLYGQKDTGEITHFYEQRFKKILVPYYIVFITVCILEVVFVREVIGFKRIVWGVICRSTIPGGEHLWFIRYILLCYIITPLLQAYGNIIKHKKSLCKYLVILFGICAIWFLFFDEYFEAAWMCCYVLGYMLGVNEQGRFIRDKIFLSLIGTLAIVGNGMQIYCTYFAHLESEGYYKIFCNFNHTFLGVFLFLLFKFVFDRIKIPEKIEKLLNITDKYSYETYLVHQFFILGPFTLMALTPFIGLNIVVIIVCIVLSTWLLKKVVEYVEGLLPKIASLD